MNRHTSLAAAAQVLAQTLLVLAIVGGIYAAGGYLERLVGVAA